nr:MAG TPA: Regulatory protein [Caudoviricetes sp.]
MKIQEMQVKDQAQKAIEFLNSGGSKKGGCKLTHNVNSYGIALKYIFALRDLSYEDVANKMQVTPQSINHIVNRMKRDKFNDIYKQKLCDTLSIDSAYFKDLVEEIDKILEA